MTVHQSTVKNDPKHKKEETPKRLKENLSKRDNFSCSIPAKKLEAPKRKRNPNVFLSLTCWPNKKSTKLSKMRLLGVAKKLSYLRKREVTTIIYFNQFNPTKNPPKNASRPFIPPIFVTNHGNGPLNAVKCFFTACFLSHFVTILAIFRCVVATIVVVFLFIVFYCFLYKLLCLFFPI